MKLKSTLFLLLILVGWSKPDKTQAQNSLLWKIDHPQKKQTGYVFGTMHVIPKDRFKPSNTLDSLIKISDLVVTEIGLDLFLEERFDLATSMVFENKTNLEDYLPKDKMDRLKRVLIDTLGFEESRLQNQYFNLKPMFMSTILLTELIGPVEAYDLWVDKKATEYEKEKGSLESVYNQIGFIDSIPMKTQLSWLDDLNSNLLEDYLDMLSVYESGDLDSLLIMSQEDPNTTADFQLRTVRNKNWIPRMKRQMETGTVFFAVGALHLPGKDGVLELLKSDGYSVKPINQ